ncbi:MAG: hypothetical protein HKN12_12200 [Gemmatimonadetes bacterium]|nr:hypothetical protein [Gemmatimonadota bacterium]
MSRSVGESTAHSVVALHRDLGVRVPSALLHAPFVRIDLPSMDPADVLQGIFDHPLVERVAVPASSAPALTRKVGGAKPDLSPTGNAGRVGLVGTGRPGPEAGPILWCGGAEGESAEATRAASGVAETGAVDRIVWSLPADARQYDVLFGVDQLLRLGADVIHAELPPRSGDTDAGWQLLAAGLKSLALHAAVPLFLSAGPEAEELRDHPFVVVVAPADGADGDVKLEAAETPASARAAGSAAGHLAEDGGGWTKAALVAAVQDRISASGHGSP